MPATIVWSIDKLDVKPAVGEYTDVVIIAYYRCSGTQDGGAQEDYQSSVYGTCTFSAPSGTFTPYDQLTEQQVLGWCWSQGVSKPATEEAVQTQINNQINPPVISPPLPWA